MSEKIIKFEIYNALSREINDSGQAVPKKLMDQAIQYNPSDELGAILDKILHRRQNDPSIGSYVTSLINMIEAAKKNPGSYRLKYIKESERSKTRMEIDPSEKLENIAEDALTDGGQQFKYLNITIEVEHRVGYG